MGARGHRRVPRNQADRGATLTMQTAAVATLSHNLNGQRLGRKGRDTRERIITVATELVATADHAQISLSAIARQAGMGMTSLYAYFTDLTEVLLAVLDPVMAEADESYLRLVATPWPDATLADNCDAFINAFYQFWLRNSSILHLRNTMADRKDARMTAQRIDAAREVIGHIVAQMGHDPDERGTDAVGMATVLYMGFERAINIATDRHFGDVMTEQFAPDVEHYLQAEARLLEFGIRSYRA